ncbi:MAG: hypothetical protein ACI82G_001264 [Bradymonadia bacterium]
MKLRSIALKSVAGSDHPTSFDASEGCVYVTLPPELAPCVPFALMTLLYPDEMSSSDLARLGGLKSDSGWRAEFEHASRRVRISRGFNAASVLFEELDPQVNKWKHLATGASDVRLMLAEMVKLPPPSVMEGLNFWVNVAPMPAVDETIGPTDGLELVGTDDYFENLLSTEEGAEPMDREQQALVAESYRRARTAEFIDEQLAETERQLAKVISRLSGMVDSTGELEQIETSLSNLGAVRELTKEERAVLTDPATRAADFDRRVASLRNEVEKARESDRAPMPSLAKNVMFLVGAAATMGLTVGSVLAMETQRWLAFGNVFTLGLCFAGYLKFLHDAEFFAKAGRRIGSVERRLVQTQSEDTRWRRQCDAIQAELGVGDLETADALLERRRHLEEKRSELRGRHSEVVESNDYKRLERKKERVQALLQSHRLAKQRIGEVDRPAYELQRDLERSRIDPHVVLWRPDDERRELDRNVKRLGQIASKYRLVSENGLHPKTVKSWLKIASRIIGREIVGITLSAENDVVDAAGNDMLEALPLPEAVALVEALRMSLHLTLVKANAPGIQRFTIQVHASRIQDDEIRYRLRKMYNGLGEKLQVVCVDSGP